MDDPWYWCWTDNGKRLRSVQLCDRRRPQYSGRHGWDGGQIVAVFAPEDLRTVETIVDYLNGRHQVGRVLDEIEAKARAGRNA